uniref:Uncharacterized protein LOC104210502 n=1 Tax=Nicotiana sylvestris TaxID=4096 RepID=A0A1U7V7I7_NICSY|nr:PREDICTED: uncharacterized protein LOC104210502 [Nicotiana sylvestris]
MDVPKKERSLALKITEGSDLEDDEMTMITKVFKKYLRSGKGSSRSENYSKARTPEKQTNECCYKYGKTNHMIKNCPLWEIEWKKERMKADDERALMAIRESDEETEVQMNGNNQTSYMDRKFVGEI